MLSRLLRRWVPGLMAGGLVVGGWGGAVVRGVVDGNSNVVSDVWEQRYRATNVAAAADADGDGRSNGAEAAAGTDPRHGGSFLQVTGLSAAGTNLALTWEGQAGKRYTVQSSAGGIGAWSNETAQLAGVDGAMGTTVPLSQSARKFFRVAVTDTDSDGDGVTDWEEAQLGMNALRSDTDHNGVADLAEVQVRVGQPNTVTVSAVDNLATEGGTDTAVFRVARAGGIAPLTVGLAAGGTATAGTDYQALPASVTIPFAAAWVDVVVQPLPDAVTEAGETVTVAVLPGPGYAVGGGSNAVALLRESDVPAGSGLTGQYFDNANTNYANATNFTGLRLTRVDPGVAFNFTNGSPDPLLDTNTFSVRWTGQVQPPFSGPWTFAVMSDDGCKLWVNGRLLIDSWRSGSFERTGTVTTLEAGQRYDVKLEYFENTGNAQVTLAWFCASQSRQTIPASRLYPMSVTAAPPGVLGPDAVTLVQGMTCAVAFAAANPPATLQATGLPPGLVFTASNGVVSGTPSQTGAWSVILTASNAAGTGRGLCVMTVTSAVGQVSREVWTGVSGTNVALIPLTNAPALTGTLAQLQGPANYSDNFGERWRGWLTAPADGNYYFWIAASDAAEFWLSNDEEPVNRVRRAWVTGATATNEWNRDASQRSAWIALEAGRRYYLEVLHQAGSGADHVAVGWSPPGESTNAPASLVPGAVLSPYAPPAFVMGQPALYVATLLPSSGTNSTGGGAATVALAFDEETAVVNIAASGLGSPTNGLTIRSASHGGAVIFNAGAAAPDADGNRTWVIGPAGGLTTAEVLAALKGGSAYVSVATAAFPGGELSGSLQLAGGARTFVPPPDPPALPGGALSASDAARFLTQATFGPTTQDIAQVQSLGIDAWLANQFALPATTLHAHVTNYYAVLFPTNAESSAQLWQAWWKTAVTAPDQLRQRVAFALGQIFVISENSSVLDERTYACANYHDLLARNAFGNFRTLLEDVTLSPAMGLYLDMRRNDKPDLAAGRSPNENYAREILQLFSIGLQQLWPDGTLKLDAAGLPVATYDQAVVVGFAHVFTGWNYAQTNNPLSWSPSANYLLPMMLVPTRHATNETKRLLDNVVLPAGQAGETDLKLALDQIFQHPNVGPFICRRLIQRLVTGNPSPGYVFRTARVFDDNGQGVRGDLQAVVRAILTDHEARSGAVAGTMSFGHQREPVLRVTALMRAFKAFSNTNTWNMGTTGSSSLQQTPLRADTVFNFYEPDYAFPGPIAAYGLVSPEFQITSESTAITAANYVRTGIYNSSGVAGDSSRGFNNDIELDFTHEVSLATNVTALVNHLDLLLMAGRMPADMRSTVSSYLGTVTATNYTGQLRRVQAAVHLISTSSQCVIQP